MCQFHRFVVLSVCLLISGAAGGDERTPRELLFDAVEHGNGAALDRALARGATLETRNNEGETPLLFAVKFGAVRGEELLLQRGANLRARDREGVSVWHAAQEECVPPLVRYGADVNECDAQGRTRLMSGYTVAPVLRLLLKHGADPNLRDNQGETAIMSTRPQYVPLLLAHGADINARDKRGETALMKWIWNGNHWYRRDAKDVAMLLRHGADVHLPHPQGSAVERAAKYINVDVARAMLKVATLTAHEQALLQRAIFSAALFDAARAGDAKTVRDLLRRGANPRIVLNKNDQYEKDGLTPLMMAAQRTPDWPTEAVPSAVARREEARDVEVSRLLLARGAEPNYQFELPIGGLNGSFALQYAATANKPRLAQILLQRGAKANLRGEGGATALFSTVGNPAVVRVLLRGGADPNARSEGGATALLLAAGHGHPDAVRMLLARKADPNAELWPYRYFTYESTATPLIAAVRRSGRDEQSKASVQREGAGIARMLLRAGARVNERDPVGQTALLHAAAYGNLPLAQLLLRAGAAIETPDNGGQTPLMAACAGRHYGLTAASGGWLLPPQPAVAALLLQQGANPNARDKNGSTPLILAARYNWRFKLGYGEPDDYKRIPPYFLQNAAAAKRCLELLLRHGANPNLRDKSGHTARDWAETNGNRTMTRLLERARSGT